MSQRVNITFLNFGGIPEKNTNLKYTGKCKVNNTNNTSSWGCGVMQLNIQNNNFTLSSSFYNTIKLILKK